MKDAASGSALMGELRYIPRIRKMVMMPTAATRKSERPGGKPSTCAPQPGALRNVLAMTAVMWAIAIPRTAAGDPVRARHTEGAAHGVLVLTNTADEALAYGELIQWEEGRGSVASRLLIRRAAAELARGGEPAPEAPGGLGQAVEVAGRDRAGMIDAVAAGREVETGRKLQSWQARPVHMAKPINMAVHVNMLRDLVDRGGKTCEGGID